MSNSVHLKVQCRRKAAHSSSELPVLHVKIIAQDAQGHALARVSNLRLAATHRTESGGHLKVLYGKVLAQDAIRHGTSNALVELLALHKDLCQPRPAHGTLHSQEHISRRATTGWLSHASAMAGRQARGPPFCG